MIASSDFLDESIRVLPPKGCAPEVLVFILISFNLSIILILPPSRKTGVVEVDWGILKKQTACRISQFKNSFSGDHRPHFYRHFHLHASLSERQTGKGKMNFLIETSKMTFYYLPVLLTTKTNKSAVIVQALLFDLPPQDIYRNGFVFFAFEGNIIGAWEVTFIWILILYFTLPTKEYNKNAFSFHYRLIRSGSQSASTV